MSSSTSPAPAGRSVSPMPSVLRRTLWTTWAAPTMLVGALLGTGSAVPLAAQEEQTTVRRESTSNEEGSANQEGSTNQEGSANQEGRANEGAIGSATVVEIGEEPQDEGAETVEPEPVLGDEERLRLEELREQDPPAIGVESMEMALLELEVGAYGELIRRLGPEVVPRIPAEGERISLLERHLLLHLARAHERIGEVTVAEDLYRHLSTELGDLTARSRLALLLQRRGEREEADALYYSLIDAYNRAARMSVEQLIAVGVACRELGRDDPQLFQDAVKAFDEAIEASRGRPRGNPARVEMARLFVQKYDSAEARKVLGPTLETDQPGPEALLTQAMIDRFDGMPTARPLAEKVLEINPHHVDALVFLAGLEAEAEDQEGAAEFVERALAVNPRSLEAMTAAAGLAFLGEDRERFAEQRDQVFSVNPGYAEFWVESSLLAMRNRLYPTARDFARRAVELDPKSWSGWGELGLNQLRLGEMEEGRASLEKSFAGDPYNVWIKNTLDLLDSLDGYRVVETPRFELVLHPDEADLLAPLVEEIAERAYDSLAERYSYEPQTPIRLEVYRRHEDFSVRTVGLSGLGALGVSFGPVIAIDSPAARGIGEFNWGTTLWHEIAHTFTLGLTDGQIPRWLTEGLSVYEERQGPTGWTDDPTPDFLAAYASGRLLGLGSINDGFVRPSFPNQIGLSYYQASLVAEYVEKQWGFDRMVSMLHGYRDGLSTAEVFEGRLERTLEEFDEEFWAYLDERFASSLPTFRGASDQLTMAGEEHEEEPPSESPDPIELPEAESASRRQERARENPADYRAQLAWGLELKEQERWQEATEVLERARDLFPEYAGPGSPYHALAEIALAREDRALAAEHLQALVDLNEYDFDSHRRLAELYRELQQPVEEAEVLSRTLWIYPYERSVHERLAALAEEGDRPADRLRALRSVLALEPPSRPRVHYEIATTLRDLGRTDEARRAVLSALELAPSYRRAQDLLLELIEEIGEDS